MTRPLTHYIVPSGTPWERCGGASCGAVVYWLKLASDRWAPIDCDADTQCHRPTHREEGIGVNHFVTCPDREQFRRRRASPARLPGDATGGTPCPPPGAMTVPVNEVHGSRIRIVVAEFEGGAEELAVALSALRPMIAQQDGTAMVPALSPDPAVQASIVEPAIDNGAQRRVKRRVVHRRAGKPAKGTRGAWHERGLTLLGKGKTAAEGAVACGVTVAAVYNLRNAEKNRTTAAGAETPKQFRCAQCGRMGINPKPCDHCFEKR